MEPDGRVLSFGEFQLDLERRELRRSGERVDLQPMPLRLLLYLAAHRDRTVSSGELLETLWPGVHVTDTALANALSQARHVVGDDGATQRVVQTLKGHGYRFVAELTVSEPAPAGRPQGLDEPAGQRATSGRWPRVALGVAALTALALLFVLVFSTRDDGGADPERTFRYDLAFPEERPIAFYGGALAGIAYSAFAISSDASLLVYMAREEDRYGLYLRDMNTGEVRALPGTGNAYGPFFSPGDRWIGYFAGNRLEKIRVDGGQPLVVAETPNPLSGTWTEDGSIFVAIEEGTRLVRVAAEGGRIETVLRPSEPGGWISTVRALPAGDRLLLSMGNGVHVFDPTTRLLERVLEPRTTVFGGITLGRYAGGFLLYAGDGALRATRFDPQLQAARGPEVPVLDDLRLEVAGYGQWSVSTNGTLLYAAGSRVDRSPLSWVSGDAVPDSLELPGRSRRQFELAPDGRELAVVEESAGRFDVWLYDLETRLGRKLTADGVSAGPLVWIEDQRLIYHKTHNQGVAPYLHRLNTGTGDQALLPDEPPLEVISASADGRYHGLDILTRDEGRPFTPFVIDRQTGEKTRIPTLGQGMSWGTAIAPDASAVAYVSDESGSYHVYLQPFPITGTRLQVSRSRDAEEPHWSADGSAIYYRSGQSIMRASVSTTPELSAAEPEVFFEGEFINFKGRSYDISADGSRALVIVDPETTTTSLRVVTNWFAEVEALVAEAEAGVR